MPVIAVVNKVEITENGTIQVQIKKIFDDKGLKIDLGWHRTSLTPGTDCNAQLALVNTHLSQMGFVDISNADWQRVRDHAAVAWTPQVIAEYGANSAQDKT
jgi:hypothetical protein